MRGDVGGTAGIVAGRRAVAQPFGFEIKAAQAKHPHLRIVQHRLEFLAGAVMIAFEQRGLRVEKMDQRLLVRADQLGRLLVFLARQGGVAGAGRDHAGR